MSTTATSNEPPLPPDSEAAARFHAYNEWLKGEESATVAKAFAAGWKTGAGYAYENAAVIAENCTQDDAARDEPFRIAQTIREAARGQS